MKIEKEYKRDAYYKETIKIWKIKYVVCIVIAAWKSIF